MTDTHADSTLDAPALTDATKGKIDSEVLQNITVTLSIEVGRAMIKIRDLMRLTRVAPAAERMKNL